MVKGLRATDTVIRLGGDEFVIILTEVQVGETIVSVLEKLRSAIVEPMLVSGHRLQVACSAGVACYPRDGADLKTLLAKADTAMYHAKEHGGDRFQFYDERMMQVKAPEATDGLP
jgi:diguanylate cyclase (GGDEF)-like protein